MNKLGIIIAMVLVLSGCKTRTVVVTVPKVRTDTLIITKSQRDSIWLHDSIHVSEKTENDTVWLEVKKWHTKYIETRTHDTIYIATHDTIAQPYPVEVIKEVERDLSWWQKTKMWVGGIAMLLLLAWLVWQAALIYMRRY
jgi:hypothetical protein